MHNRPVLVALAVAGLLALLLLAAGLNSLELKPAELFVAPEERGPGTWPGVFLEITLVEKILLLALLVILFAILMAFLSPESRKKVLLAVLRFTVLWLVILYLLDRSQPVDILPELNAVPPPAPTGSVPQAGTVVEFQEPPLPSWVVYLASLAVLAALAGGGWWLFRRTRPPVQPPLREYGALAREALDDLATGRDWRDTIIRCYAGMCDVIRRERGLDRARPVTPAEFSRQLARAGLPVGPVERLTRLFELVRYGEQDATPEQVREASDCLADIACACGAEGI